MTNVTNPDFREIVRYATLAPSGHNSQPWKFRLSETSIEIIPDLTYSLPFVDDTNRELFISVGCALENLCIAATHFGYQTFATLQSDNTILVKFTQTDIAENQLFAQIEKRQTNRAVYRQPHFSADELVQIQNFGKEENVSLYFFEIGSEEANRLTDFIAQGNDFQMNNDEFKNEILKWIRYNRKDINRQKNGLTYEALGFPSIPQPLGKPVARLFLNGKLQNNTDRKAIASSSHLVMFTSKNNTVQEWLNLGRTLQRFLLHTSAMKIANAYMNQPCETKNLALQVQNSFSINGEFPCIILRTGFEKKKMPFSPRKDVEMVIV
jgi:hypothetical protein